MNPNHLNIADRYLWNFGRFYEINELRGVSNKNHSVYNSIRMEFIKSLGLSIPKKETQVEIIETNFEKFKDFVSERYSESKIRHCDKVIHRFRGSGKTLAKCLLDWRITRNENGRYYCNVCNAWHLTSKSFEKISKV